MPALSTYVHAPANGIVPTARCVGCAADTSNRAVRIPRTYPFGLLFGLAFLVPLVLSLAIAVIWGSRDLFDIMAGTGGRNALELNLLRALPIVVPALLATATLIALEVLCRSIGLGLHLCRRCANRQRRRRGALVGVLVVTFVALALVLYLVPALELFDRKWGILFAPWVILAALLANETPLAGMRVQALSNRILRIRGAPASKRVVEEEHPQLILAQPLARFWPTRLEMWALLAPAALVAIAMYAPRLERLPLECAYGTYPLSHRSGTARVVGCRAPDGTAHGHQRGEATAWNSNPQSPGYAGTWWFGRPHGHIQFLDANGRVLAQGGYVLGRPRGRWQVLDEWGTVLEELEVIEWPARTVVHRAHPHLKCSTSEIEATGLPAWGMRACPRYDAPAPFVRVENARVVETGMR